MRAACSAFGGHGSWSCLPWCRLCVHGGWRPCRNVQSGGLFCCPCAACSTGARPAAPNSCAWAFASLAAGWRCSTRSSTMHSSSSWRGRARCWPLGRRYCWWPSRGGEHVHCPRNSGVVCVIVSNGLVLVGSGCARRAPECKFYPHLPAGLSSWRKLPVRDPPWSWCCRWRRSACVCCLG